MWLDRQGIEPQAKRLNSARALVEVCDGDASSYLESNGFVFFQKHLHTNDTPSTLPVSTCEKEKGQHIITGMYNTYVRDAA